MADGQDTPETYGGPKPNSLEDAIAARKRLAAIFSPNSPETAPSEPVMVPNGHNQFGEDKENEIPNVGVRWGEKAPDGVEDNASMIPDKGRRTGEKVHDHLLDLSRHGIDNTFGDS